MFRSGKIFGTLASLALLISLFPSLARAGTWAAFGPQTYTRGSGAPVTSTDTITLPHPGTQYTLRIFNGGLEHNHALFVSNCEVSLNGVRIAGPKKCNDKTSEVSIPVTPLGSNILSVTVRGRKGSALAIEIIGVDNDPPTISAAIDPLPDAAGWNSSAVRVTFACADALSGVASCSPPVALSSEVVGKVVTGTATDVAGNTATVSATVNISFTFFKVRSWQTNLPGDPLQTGKCLDYGTSSSGTSVFLNDCVNAHSIRVVEISPRDQTDAQGNLIALCQQDSPPNPPIPHTFCHEVMLFAGNQVIGIDAPQTKNGGFGPPTTEYTLTLQTPWTSFHGVIPPNISPAHQIFAYDGDSIILESSRPCVNTGATTAANICPPPPSQMVIQIQNARGANGSALVAGVRNLADNEFWDFVPLPGSSPYPTTGFVPVATSYDLWNALCMTPTVNRALGVPGIGSSTNPMLAFTGQFGPGAFAGCVAPNAGWGSVIVVTDSDPNECADPETIAGSPPNIGPCIDLSYYPPLVLPAGVTVRGNRRGTSFGPQLYLNDFAPGTRPSPPGACDCIASIQGDYARVTGLRLRGQSRSTNSDEPGTEGVDVAFPLQPPGSVSLTEFIATVDHNDMSDWGSAAVNVLNPYPANSFGDVKNEAATLANVTIARNFLHHNERDFDGYGVLVGRALIQGNTSLMNRHTIAAGGEPHTEYRASYNLMLHSPRYCDTIVGPFHCYHNQDFDIHGTGDGGYGGTAGFYIDIVGNTFLEPGGHDYWLRGRPLRHSDYLGNVSLRKENDAVQDVVCSPSSFGCIGTHTDPFFPVNIHSNNQFADSTPSYTNPTDQLGVGDFDGDGTDDLFLATGAAWYYSPGGKAEWRFLSAKTDRIDGLLLGDFDGDGRTDVLGMNPSGQLVVSWGGISDWEVLNRNPCPNSVVPPIKSCAITDMAVGKFLDHTDGVPRDDLFLADGSNWYLSSGGSVPFSFVNNSSFRRKDVLLGDFDGDGKTDVFGVVFDTQHNVNSWSFTSKAAGDWIFLRPALTSTVNRLVAADFRGNKIADVGAPCDNGWRISSGGNQGWSGCNKFPSGFTRVNGGVGHFSGSRGADILLWNRSNGIDVFSAGTGPSGSLSWQDMR